MPAHRLAFSLGVALAALSGCDTLSARHRAHDGVDFYKSGDYHQASYKFEQAAKLDPSLDTLHLNLAYTYMQLHQNAPKSGQGIAYGGLAVKEFEEYLRRRPDNPAAKSYLIQTFVDTNRYDDAVEYFKPATSKQPPDLEAIATLGQIAAKTNRIEKALDWYEERVHNNPKDPDAHYNLAVLVWDHLHNHGDIVGLRRLQLADRAIESLRKSIELRPQFADGYTYLNLVLRERSLGAPDDAARALDTSEADKYLKVALDMKKGAPPPAQFPWLAVPPVEGGTK